MAIAFGFGQGAGRQIVGSERGERVGRLIDGDGMKRKGSTLMLLAATPGCGLSVLSPSNDLLSQPRAKLLIEHKTDHGTGITSIKLEPMLIQYTEASKAYITLSAFSSYEDNSPTKPKLIVLSFHSRSPICRFPDRSATLLLLEPETITLGSEPNPKSGEGVMWAYSEREGDVCNESFSVFISEQTLIKITKAKTVGVQFGRIDLRLSDVHLEGLRDLAARIVNVNGVYNTSRDRCLLSDRHRGSRENRTQITVPKVDPIAKFPRMYVRFSRPILCTLIGAAGERADGLFPNLFY